jgi:hypothetical protein
MMLEDIEERMEELNENVQRKQMQKQQQIGSLLEQKKGPIEFFESILYAVFGHAVSPVIDPGCYAYTSTGKNILRR